MEIGCHLPTTQPSDVTREALVTFAQEAEKRNVASLWVSDHVVIPRIVFRREDHARMLEILDLVTGEIRPALDRA
jgi:alkanesulfonate monooxygenase SsuD/methylene tetrahydromethanopterin reductase-like flavin-dependent oxidoreductase (luciferase family)